MASAVSERVGALFQRLTSRKREQAVDVWGPYSELVTALASDQVVDIDDLESILEQAGKDQAALEKDVATKIKRLEWAAQMHRGQAAKKEMEAAEKRLADLEAELEAVRKRVAPQIEAAAQVRRESEALYFGGIAAENRLDETCFNPDVIERKRQLGERVRELVQQERELRERLGNQRGELGFELYDARDCLEKLLAEQQPPAEKLAQARSRLKSVEARMEAVNEELAAIQRERQQIDVENKRLHAESLVP